MGRHALRALNFFMADMQLGIGPFVGVYLIAHGWQTGMIGSIVLWTTLAPALKPMRTLAAARYTQSRRRKRAPT